MGLKGFFGFIDQRYPCVCEAVLECQVLNFDTLYLDLNDILYRRIRELNIKDQDIFKNVFNVIELMFEVVKPQKLLFLAIDGVAPCAKLNRQNFLNSNEEDEVMLLKSQCKFDANSIKPGTLFMTKLIDQLKYFITYKISNDREWQNCKVILSGPEVPGEGEQKIIDHIKFLNSEPDYNPNMKHCIYGQDADLIILSLCSHVPNIFVIRNIKLSDVETKETKVPAETKFTIVHLSLLKKYIEYEFSSLKKKINFFNVEKIIDDWILMGFLIGNDYIPPLPNLNNFKKAFPLLSNVYIEILPTLGGYMNESGTLNLSRFEIFMRKVSDINIELLTNFCNDLECCEDNVMQTNVDNNALPKDLIQNNAESISVALSDKLNIDKCSNNDEIIEENNDDTDNKNSNKCDIIDALRSQIESYIKTIQWILSYYYKDCCSWTWSYPYFFSPHTYNIKNFKDLKFDFELGKPVQPYLLLLKIIPIYSKNILPIAFQNILREEEEKERVQIVKNISATGRTDVNSQKDDKWKAVSRRLSKLPIRSQEILSTAIEKHYNELTDEERLRNNYGPMRIFTYTEDDLGVYLAPEYFPNIDNNHAKCSVQIPDKIITPVEKLVWGQSLGEKFIEYFPGFPTLQFIEHTANLENEVVKPHDSDRPPTIRHVMALNVITKEDSLDLQTIASEILEKVVYVNWPYLTKAKVVAVSNSNVKLYTDDKNYESNDCQFCTAVVNKLMWNKDKENVTETYKNRWFINIGRTDILVHAHPLLGTKYIFDTQGLLRREMQWSEELMIYAYQMVLKNVPTLNDNMEHQRTVFDVFSPGCKCFMIGRSYYGSMVEVYDNEHYSTSGKVKISATVIEEPNLNKIKFTQLCHKTQYVNGFKISHRLGIKSHVVNLFTGDLRIADKDSNFEIHNVGLNLKWNKQNKEVHGYSKKLKGRWLYSERVFKILDKYMIEWPELFEKMHHAIRDVHCYKLDLPVKENVVRISEFLKKQKFHDSERLVCGTNSVEIETIREIEKELDDYVHRAPSLKKKIVLMQVEPNLLLKPELLSRNWPPDCNSNNELLDRVVCIRDDFTVPINLKGVIIAIEKEDKRMDNKYTILFDKPFIGGLTFSGCAKNRCYRLLKFDFLNISYSERSEEKEKISGTSFNTLDGNASKLNTSWRSTSY